MKSKNKSTEVEKMKPTGIDMSSFEDIEIDRETYEKIKQITAERSVHQLNIEVSTALRDRAKMAALLDQTTLKAWCAKAIEAAAVARLKGDKLPFEFPATPFSPRVLV